jgi:hypothetical protein
MANVDEIGDTMATTTEETVVITNVKTGETYASDVHAAEDVANPETETSEGDIKRDVVLSVLKGVGGAGAAG